MLLHHLPLSRPAYMDLTRWHWAWPSSAPRAGWAASVGDQQGWGWGLGAECPGSLLWNPKCGVLLPRWGLACPVTRCQLICTHTQSTGAVLLSRGTLTWSRCYQLSFGRAFVERGRALHQWETAILAIPYLWQALRGDEEIWWGWQKILRADYNPEWNQECLAHLLVYFEEPSKCQFSSGFM